MPTELKRIEINRAWLWREAQDAVRLYFRPLALLAALLRALSEEDGNAV